MSQNYVPLHDKMGTKPGNNHVLGVGGGGGGGGGFGQGIIHTKQVSNAQDEDFQTGRSKPPVYTVEKPQSVNILIDSKHRLETGAAQNLFDFSVTLSSNLYRARFVQVKKVIIPKIPNINPNNNRFIIYYADPDTDVSTPLNFEIPGDFYNPSTFCNEVNTQLNLVAPPNVIFACEYLPQRHRFKLICTTNFYISNESTFITFGGNFIPFPSLPPTAEPIIEGSTEIVSGIACMLYTRYIYLCSEALNTFAYAVAKVSDPKINEDVLAIVDVTENYLDTQVVGAPYTANCRSYATGGAPIISLRNPQRNLSPEMDCYVLDEFCKDLNIAFSQTQATSPYEEPNQLGIAFWLEVTF